MDIKEIALKHAREYLSFKLGGRKGCDVEEIVGDDEIYAEIVNELAGQFEALVAEIQRRGEPVGFRYVAPDGSWCFNEMKAGDVAEPVFTFPPSIEALEDKVAEACADYIHRKVGVLEDVDKVISAIRSGEWKKFRKGGVR